MTDREMGRTREVVTVSRADLEAVLAGPGDGTWTCSDARARIRTVLADADRARENAEVRHGHRCERHGDEDWCLCAERVRQSADSNREDMS